MKIKRLELIKILQKLMPGIAKNESMEAMTYFFFSGKNIIAYNDKICIQYPMVTDFSLFVKASDFFKLLSKIKDEEVELSYEKNHLKIDTKKTKISLSTITDKELIERIKSVNKSFKESKWKKLPKDFMEKASLCSYTASKMEQEGTLTCVHLKEELCTSSDNTRISQAKLSSPVDEMLLKASVIKDLNLISPNGYKITKSWIHFKDENKCVFSVVKIKGDFPDFSKFTKFKGKEINIPSSILDAIDLVSILTDPDSPSINIKISKGIILIKSRVQNGNIRHRYKIDSGDTELELVINPQFLKDMIKFNSKIIIAEDKAKIETENDFFMITALYG